MGPKLQKKNHNITGQKPLGKSLEKSENRFRSLFDDMLEGIQILGHDWQYLYLNASAEKHNRRPSQELLGRKYMDMWPGIESTHVFSVIERCMEERVASQLENRFVYPDGMVGWFMLSIQPIPEGVLILSFDITERIRAEKQVAQMKRLYATLSQVNQTIVRVKEPDELYRSICDVAVQFGEFSLAWVGLLDEASGEVNPVAAKGLDVTQWPFPIINIHEGRLKNGLVTNAILTSKVVTSEDIQTDKRIKSLHGLFQEYGYHSSAAVPFQLRDRTIGILNLVSREAGLFMDKEEVRLLEEMGMDISFSLETMESEKIKRLWADAFEHCAHGMAIGLPSTNQILTCNPAFARLQGRTVQEISSMSILSQYAPQDHKHVKQSVAEADRTGSTQYEAHMIRKDGSLYPVQMDLVSVRDEHGNLLYRVATQQDVSDRKRAYEAVRESQARLTSVIDSAMDAIISLDADQRIILFNPAAEQMFGCTAAEAIGQQLNQFIPLRFRDSHREHIRAFGQSNLPTRAMGTLSPLTCLRANGEEFPAEITISQTEMAGQKIYTAILRDATERVQAQQALRASERTLKLFVEYAPAAIAMFDREMVYIAASRRYISDYRLTDENVVGRSHYEIFPEIPERWKEIHRRCLAGEVEKVEEDPFPRLDGTLDWVRWEIHPWYEKSGEIGGIVLFSEVITERKRAEEALRGSETRFRSLIENSSDEISIMSAEGKLMYESPTANPTLGYQAGEFFGQNLFQLIHPDDLERVQEQFARLTQDPSLHPRDQFRLRHRNGNWRWVEAVGTNLLAEPSVRGIVINYHDITDRKQAEEALRQSEERHRQVSSLISDYVYSGTFFPDGKIKTEWASGAFERITGYSLEEINRLPAGYSTVVLPEDLKKVISQQSELFEKGSLNIEYRIRRKDGEIRWLRDYIHYMASEGMEKPTRLIGAVQDITERKRSEETLRMSENRFRLATKATNDVIWEWNAKTSELMWTENAQVVFGYLPEEIGPEEKWWDEHIHPDDRERIVSKMDALIAGNESIWSEEYRFRRRDDSYAYISDHGYIEREASGEAIRMVGAMSDISERKQAEKQVQLQLQRMSALSEIDRAISSSLDMRLSLDILLSEVLSQLGVDAASVLLLNESKLTLEYFAGKGFWTLAIRQSRMRLGEGNAGQVGLERKLLHIPNLLEAREQFERADLLKREEFTEYFGVPLVAKGMLKGVLEIFHRSPLDPDPEWMNYLETLSGQAAIAIDNAQLFENMQKSNLELIAAYDATIAGWSHAMDLRDKETEDHTQRVTELTLKIAEKMGISQQEQVQIRRGALLHDIGKLGVPDQILLKRGKLSEEEWAIMRQHPTYAFEMLSSINYLRHALDIPYCHHEKWDGSGYPRGMKGEQIPLAARIFAVVDVWDALTSDRPYRKAWSTESVLEYIKEQSGHHFDPDVVDVFLESNASGGIFSTSSSKEDDG